MKQIDYLSPPITLFFFGRRTHTSEIGGLLVICMLIICFSYILYLLTNHFSHNNVTSMFYKKFEYEAGYYSFNSSSLFHFFLVYNSAHLNFDVYDPKKIRIYTTFALNIKEDSDWVKNDHWVFDKCQEGIDNKNVDKSLFENIENFSYGACLRYFYNSTIKEYISNDNVNFIWPYMEHGTVQKDNIYVNTIVEKCVNNSISNKVLGGCNSDSEIDKYLDEHKVLYFYFKDNLVDPTNYLNPVQSYLYAIASGTGKGISYVENNVHFSPLKIITDVGILFKSYNITNSVFFDQNRKGEAENSLNSSILVKYNFLIQNNIQIYEREYTNIFNIFSNMVGVVQLLYYIFYSINFLYNKYIILVDTNSLFFRIKKRENHIYIINLNSKLKQRYETTEHNSNLEIFRISKSKNNIRHLNNNIIKDSDNKNKIIFDNLLRKKSDFIPLSKRNQDILINNSNFSKDELNEIRNIYINNNNNDNSNLKMIKKCKTGLISRKLGHNFSLVSRKKIKNGQNIQNGNEAVNIKNNNYSKEFPKLEKDSRRKSKMDYSMLKKLNLEQNHRFLLKQDFSFFYCLKIICIKGRRYTINLLIDFRRKLLSEEHIFKSHLTEILLEKQYKIKSKQDISLNNVYEEL